MKEEKKEKWEDLTLLVPTDEYEKEVREKDTQPYMDIICINQKIINKKLNLIWEKLN